jgi:hypothetical protein
MAYSGSTIAELGVDKCAPVHVRLSAERKAAADLHCPEGARVVKIVSDLVPMPFS